MDPTLAEMETELYESPPRPSIQTLLRVLEYCTYLEESHHLPYPFYKNMVMVAFEMGQGRHTDRVRTFCRDWEDLIVELDKIDAVSRSEMNHHGAPPSSR
jgi:hypothetical protein